MSGPLDAWNAAQKKIADAIAATVASNIAFAQTPGVTTSQAMANAAASNAALQTETSNISSASAALNPGINPGQLIAGLASLAGLGILAGGMGSSGASPSASVYMPAGIPPPVPQDAAPLLWYKNPKNLPWAIAGGGVFLFLVAVLKSLFGRKRAAK